MKHIYLLTTIIFVFITNSNAQITDVVTGLSGPEGIVLIGNELYIAEFNANKISKIDITATSPATIDVVTGLSSLQEIVVNGNDLYISLGNKISKFNPSTLSLNENLLIKRASIFPNPSNQFIQLSGLSKAEKYSLYNASGIEVNNGNISNNEKIDIYNLTKGLYFLKFENGDSLKFIKE